MNHEGLDQCSRGLFSHVASGTFTGQDSMGRVLFLLDILSDESGSARTHWCRHTGARFDRHSSLRDPDVAATLTRVDVPVRASGIHGCSHTDHIGFDAKVHMCWSLRAEVCAKRKKLGRLGLHRLTSKDGVGRLLKQY